MGERGSGGTEVIRWLSPSTLRRWILFIVHCALVILFAACRAPGADVVPTFVLPPTYAPSDFAHTVAYGRIAEMVEMRGRVIAKQESLLVFPLGGALKAVHVSPGDQVEEGDSVAELDAPEAEKEVLRAQFDLDLAEAELELAELTLAFAQSSNVLPAAVTISTEPEGPYFVTVLLPTDATTEMTLARIAVERAEEELKQAAIEWDKAIHRYWEPLEVTESYTWTLQL
ncbi:MAG: efflux RND transporter periplasmic adaptor subunit, partial [Anaerolineae bacterium]